LFQQTSPLYLGRTLYQFLSLSLSRSLCVSGHATLILYINPLSFVVVRNAHRKGRHVAGGEWRKQLGQAIILQQPESKG